MDLTYKETIIGEEGQFLQCEKCNRILHRSSFFTFKNNERDNYCKDCRIGDAIDSKPWTFFPIMKYFDIPFIEEQWLKMMIRTLRSLTVSKVPYRSIFGKYYSTMRLCSYRKYGFKDSAFLNSVNPIDETLRNLILSRESEEEYQEYLNSSVFDNQTNL